MGHQVVSQKSIAKTYRRETAWETVQQYRQAVALSNNEADLPRAEIARRVDRSPSTVRGWLVEGKRPAPVKAIETARDHGWLSIDTSSEIFRALNQLVAWIFSGGGIRRDRFVPIFSVDDEIALTTLEYLLRWMDLSSRIREYESSDRALEVIPDTDASIFGRVLYVLGSPVGIKATHETLSLPTYLETTSESHRRDFARIYLLNRGAGLDANQGKGTRIAEARPEAYRQALRDFFASVTTGSVTLGSQGRLWISAEAVDDLADQSPIRPHLAGQAAYGSITPPTTRAVATTYRRQKQPGGYRYAQVYERVQTTDDDVPLKELVSLYPDFPKQTLRNWRRGHVPRVAQALTEVQELGWITPPATSDTALCLTALVAWIFARGTLRTSSYHPVFRIGAESDQAAFDVIAGVLELPYSCVRENDASRPTELHPSAHGGVLGRTLYVLGVPRGRKTEVRCLPPGYLYTHPAHIRQFVATWCRHHTIEITPASLRLRIPKALGPRFTEGLANLLEIQYEVPVEQTSVGLTVDQPSDELLMDAREHKSATAPSFDLK